MADRRARTAQRHRATFRALLQGQGVSPEIFEAHDPEDVERADELLRVVGESCYALRPLTYLLLRAIKPKKRLRWLPAVVCVAMDVVSIRCVSRASTRSAPHKISELFDPETAKLALKVFLEAPRRRESGSVESAEYQRRALDLVKYAVIRDPAFTTMVQPRLESMTKSYEESGNTWMAMVPNLALSSLDYYHEQHFHQWAI